jgi:hypothetical protein
MSLEPSPELERAHQELLDAYNAHDTVALRRLISTHPAVVSRGTAPDEVFAGHENLIAAIAAASDTKTARCVEAYADGDLGYVYSETSYVDSDGTEYPSRSLVIAHREDGQWRYLHGLNAIPVPNTMLTPESQFARAR